MNKVIRFSFINIVSIVFLAGFLFGLSQLISSPAQAANCGGSIGQCIGINIKWQGDSSNNGNSPPLGSGPGKPNTTTKPKPIPTACFTGAHYTVKETDRLPNIPGGWGLLSGSGCVPHYKVDTKFNEPGNGFYCSDSTEGGIIRKSVGSIQNDVFTVKFAQKYNPESGLNTRVFYGYVQTSTNHTCIYPKMTEQATNKYCALNANATLDRLANSRAGAGRIKTFKVNIASVNGLKTGSDACKQSASMSPQSGLKSNPNTWGQYKLSGKIQFVRCTQYKVTFNGSTKTQFSCGGTQNTPAQVSYHSLWCNGAKDQLVNKSWTMNDCLDSERKTEGGYSCTVPAPMYDGKKGTVQTLRDGKSRVLNWGAPKTGSSVRSTKNWEQAVTIKAGSSPRLTSVGDNDKSKQMFWSNVNFGTKWVANKNQQNVAFYNASNPGQSWSATRKLRFDGQFKTIVSDITSYNPWTGKSSSTKRVVWVSDYNIKCNTATSPKIQALRSIGDAQ